MLRNKAVHQLNSVILPYWQGLRDRENGGYYGYVDFLLNVDKKAPKSVILNSRILWFFSSASVYTGDKQWLDCAHHAYDFMRRYCIDKANGGVYWMVTYDGIPVEEMKHTYNQAFAVYALSTYYEASGDSHALQLAMELFELLEARTVDSFGYQEAFSTDWQPIENDKLSKNGIIAERTMNTLLHLLEAYTELYRVSNNTRVQQRLCWLLDAFVDKVYNPHERRLDVFFDTRLHSLIDLQSYGHDIEASWLLDRACQVVDYPRSSEVQGMTSVLVDTVVQRALAHDSLANECHNGQLDETRVWWVQAEAVVGLVNKWQQTGNMHYHNMAEKVFTYIESNFVDHRSGGEWFWDLDKSGKPTSQKPITEPWKCPYHNGRMCFEIMRRIDDDQL